MLRLRLKRCSSCNSALRRSLLLWLAIHVAACLCVCVCVCRHNLPPNMEVFVAVVGDGLEVAQQEYAGLEYMG